jgi:hypothetical protein
VQIVVASMMVLLQLVKIVAALWMEPLQAGLMELLELKLLTYMLQ